MAKGFTQRTFCFATSILLKSNAPQRKLLCRGAVHRVQCMRVDMFHTSAKCELRVISHGVRFVKNDQFHARAEQPLRAGEFLDLASHHIDSSVVRSVQLSINKSATTHGNVLTNVVECCERYGINTPKGGNSVLSYWIQIGVRNCKSRAHVLSRNAKKKKKEAHDFAGTRERREHV